MKRSDFFYELPEDLIARFPSPERDGSRLLVYERKTEAVSHVLFRDLPRFLRSGDCLVLNDTQVLPVRFLGRRKTGAKIEALFLNPSEEKLRALIRGKGKVKEGEILELEGGISCRLDRRAGRWGEWEVSLPESPALSDLLSRGRAPLPPYITWSRKEEFDKDADLRRYQTVYARSPGSIAAPTAGLHFTTELLEAVEKKGVETEFVTLHVGPGTFLPVRVEEIENHEMVPERYELTTGSADKIQAAKERGGRIIAVGTTVTRVLESLARDGRPITSGRGECSLFIHPPYKFRAIDALITNFHLPESTLLMLVCALIGREKCLEIYRLAVREGYRFFSYGDAMLIL